MKRIPPFRNRRDVFYLVHEEPTKESENGIYIVKPKDNSYRAIWAVVWDVPLKLMSTSDGYTKEEVDKIISTIKDYQKENDKLLENIKLEISKLNSKKADRTELANVVAGLVPMGSAANLAELETKPKRNNDAYYVEDQLSPEGNAYIYRWDAGLNLWVNTKQVVFKDVITQGLGDSSNKAMSQKAVTDELAQAAEAVNAKLNTYEEKAKADYDQTGFNSRYQSFVLQANKKYRLTLTFTNWTAVASDRVEVYLYASSTGSAEHVIITSLFGGATELIKGEPISIEYTPSFNYNFMRTETLSTYSPDEGCHVLAIAEEIVDNYAKKEVVGDLNDLDTTDKSNIVSAVNSLVLNSVSSLSINIFGDILPTAFKNKLYGDDDLLIVCQGDSLTGLVQNCSQSENPAQVNPFGRYNHFVSMLQYNVGKIKPYYNRLDSLRNDADVFVKIGTWAQVSNSDFGPLGTPDIPDKYKDSSESARTFRSADTNASISFVFDADTYDKCNIFFTKNIKAGNAEIVISEGNGKMLVSEDRVNWVEANGFTHSQALVGEYVFNGNPYVERHRRLWMKKENNVSGEINITYRRADTGTEYIYCWGTEMYKGRAILFDNIGRGGRPIELLAENIGDVFDRKPDLTIFQMSLANDLYHATTTTELYSKYSKYFTDDAVYSYKNRSNDYTNFPIVILLPHIRSTSFNGDSATFQGSTQTILTDPAYDIYKKVWGWLHTQLDQYDNVSFINLLDQYLNEAKVMYGSYQTGLSSGNLTADTTHLNQKGSDLYVKYLSPIFQI